MIKEYLKYLKTNGNFSWHDISLSSGLPEATIRKIFSGETADPRFETVVRLVSAMGGSLDKINAIEKVEIIEKSEDMQGNSLDVFQKMYEDHIKDIKESLEDQVKSLKQDKKILIAFASVLGAVLLAVLLFDLFVGTIGWVRY